MPAGGIYGAEVVFLTLLFLVVLFAVLARKLQTPYPIVLVIAGLLISLSPRMPHIYLNPDIIFLVALPPLLYSAAWLTSWREFKFNLLSISFLAIGLVVFTVRGVAWTAQWIFPGFNWQLGFVLGAVIATTDAIAATSIAKRVGLPQRIVDILEGESLVNDATGLLALQFGIGMVVNSQIPKMAEGALHLGFLIVVGLAIGLLGGLLVEWFERRIDDGPIEIVLSILTPYVVYLAAQAAHGSGVLAVVACGLYLSRKSSQFFSASVRMQAWAVWESLTFAINGIVFVLIGLQLPQVLAGIHEYRLSQLVLYGALLSAIVILLRLLWIYPGAYIAYLLRTRVLHQKYPLPSVKQIFVVGWTGMRGVVALAAALALPETLADGRPFPQRNLIVFLTFSVISGHAGAAGADPAPADSRAGPGRQAIRRRRRRGSAPHHRQHRSDASAGSARIRLARFRSGVRRSFPALRRAPGRPEQRKRANRRDEHQTTHSSPFPAGRIAQRRTKNRSPPPQRRPHQRRSPPQNRTRTRPKRNPPPTQLTIFFRESPPLVGAVFPAPTL